MKKSITKTFLGVLFSAAIMLVITSCNKDHNSDLNDVQTEADINNSGARHASSNCGCNFPDTLKTPAGNQLSLQVYAKGVQIYEVKRSTTNPAVFSWVNIAPSATLYQRPGFTHPIGTHYAGPSWEFTKGQYKNKKVVASKLVGITVDATAIPWLLLKTVDSLSSAGNKIRYIQRICTTGGLAPTAVANEGNLGKLDSIPYTASYLFYEAIH